jgi:hypothetical protein
MEIKKKKNTKILFHKIINSLTKIIIKDYLSKFIIDFRWIKQIYLWLYICVFEINNGLNVLDEFNIINEIISFPINYKNEFKF